AGLHCDPGQSRGGVVDLTSELAVRGHVDDRVIASLHFTLCVGHRELRLEERGAAREDCAYGADLLGDPRQRGESLERFGHAENQDASATFSALSSRSMAQR